YALTAGCRTKVLLEIEGAGRCYVTIVESLCLEGRPFTGTRSGVDLNAEVAGELHRGHANAAGGCVDEQLLAPSNSCQIDQCVVCGGKYGGYGHGLRKGPARGYVHQQFLLGYQDRAYARHQTHDPISGDDCLDVLPHLEDDAGGLTTEQPVVGDHAQRDDD